jgi:hypothetical protein
MATDGNINEISLAIGKLQAGVEQLQRTASDDRVASAQYRTDMRREMQELKQEVAGYKSNQDQAIGAARAIKFLWIMLAGVVGALGSTIVSFIRGH